MGRTGRPGWRRGKPVRVFLVRAHGVVADALAAGGAGNECFIRANGTR